MEWASAFSFAAERRFRRESGASMTSTTIYEHQLPPENDPAVVALARRWIDDARGAQRPLRAMAYAVPSTLLGVVLWGELNRWTGFEMHWYVMAGSALVLGVLLGRPCRTIGALFDRRWAAVLFACGFAMGVIGDLYAGTALIASRTGVDWTTVIATFGEPELGAWLTARTPIDWMVAAIAGAGAGIAGRPVLDEPQLVMQSRIEICRQRLEAEHADAAQQSEWTEPSSP